MRGYDEWKLATPPEYDEDGTPYNRGPSMLTDTITDEQIRALRTEASQAGDHAQALICDIALGEVDADDGYGHLRIWSFLSPVDQRKVRKLNQESAREECDRVASNARSSKEQP